MFKIRYKKHLFRTDIGKHPKFIKNKLSNLNKEQFGFSAFGLKGNTNFNYLEFPRELKKKYF